MSPFFSPLPWQTQKSEQGDDLIIFNVRYDYVKNPRNNKTLKAVVLESSDSVNVVAITKEDKVLMVEQYRFGIQQTTIELPGGFVDAEEDTNTAAKRELREETGFTSTNWALLGTIQSNPVFMDSHIHHWIARDVERTELMDLDEGEDIQLLELDFTEIKAYIRDGKIAHPHTISALARVFPIWNETKDHESNAF